MSDQRRKMTDDDFHAWAERATPERLEQAAETIQVEAWRLMAAGDAHGARLDGIAAVMRLLADQRRGM